MIYSSIKESADHLFKARLNKVGMGAGGQQIVLKVNKTNNFGLLDYISKEDADLFSGLGGVLTQQTEDVFKQSLSNTSHFLKRHGSKGSAIMSHLILSVGKEDNQDSFQSAVKQFVKDDFIKAGFNAVYAFHHDTENTHAHILVNNLNYEGYLLRRNKPDLHYWKERACYFINQELGYDKYNNVVKSFEEKLDKKIINKKARDNWLFNFFYKKIDSPFQQQLFRLAWQIPAKHQQIRLMYKNHQEGTLQKQHIDQLLLDLSKPSYNKKMAKLLPAADQDFNNSVWEGSLTGLKDMIKNRKIIEETEALYDSIGNDTEQTNSIIQAQINTNLRYYLLAQMKWLKTHKSADKQQAAKAEKALNELQSSLVKPNQGLKKDIIENDDLTF